jgi:murein DD-endopeptidase MepM/ murein hydrolase activator NlpD
MSASLWEWLSPFSKGFQKLKNRKNESLCKTKRHKKGSQGDPTLFCRMNNSFFAFLSSLRLWRRDPLSYFGYVAVFLFFFVAVAFSFFFQGTETIGDSVGDSKQNSFFLKSQKSNSSPPQSFFVLQDSAIKASLPPVLMSDSRALAVFTVAEEPGEVVGDSREGIVEYIVQSGDTVSAIAEKFHISLDTLFWANDLNRNSALKPGQKLIILPVDGILHYVKKGDTISAIAKTYQADASKIIAFNNLSGEGDIYVGDILVIPGGKMPKSAPKVVSQPPQIAIALSYFINPLGPFARITQGLHWYNAVDMVVDNDGDGRGDCGQPIFAAAEGMVLKVAQTNSSSRWVFNGAGNHLTILHPNGVVTYYGHFASSFVVPGQHVSQGQLIATVGGLPGTPGAGLATGCHLHFGVTGAKNPFVR